MKIIHIIPSLEKGGAERVVIDICNALQKDPTVDVKLITFRSNNEYSFLTKTINWFVIPSKVKISIYKKHTFDVQQLQNFIDKCEPDIIHSHLFETEIVLSKIIFRKVKFFVHFHDNMKQFNNLKFSSILSKTEMMNFYEKKYLLNVYKSREVCFIAISKDNKKFALRSLPKRYKIVKCCNAIDLLRFTPKLSIKKENHISIIGSLVENKGQDLAIDVVDVLKKRGLVVYLNILGNGPKKSYLEAKVKKINLDSQIIFHGNVDFPEETLQNSLIYLHTAYEESFGLALIEAMACGLPVVCTDGKGNRDLIEEGSNGFMIFERSAELLADKIEFLLKHDNIRLELSRNANKFATKYGITEYCKKLLYLYNNESI